MSVLLPVISMTNGTVDAATCKECGGVCCRQAAGIASPCDFGPVETLVDVLVSYLRTGFWAVDWWEGDIRPDGDLNQIYYVRPAHTNAIGKIRDASWGGTCRMWSEDYGCSLAFENRPSQCRHLIPSPPECRFPDGFNKEATVQKWIPYQWQVEKAIDIALAERQTSEAIP